MKMICIRSIAIFLLTIATLQKETLSDPNSKVVCYFGAWTTYRPGDGKFDPENIDPSLCTHLMYAFAGLNQNSEVESLDPYYDITLDAFRRFNSLKQRNPNLKTLLSVGGWNEGSTKYSQAAADPASRRRMIDSTVNLLQQYGFDGFDLDWEYPNQRGGSPADIQNFVTLMREYREEFNKYGYLLTAAVGATSNAIALSYNVPELSNYLDWFNVMTYDMHGSFEPVTGINAPLYASSQDADRGLNVDACVQAWIGAGAPRNKIVVGTGSYGRSFALSDPSNHGLNAPTTGGGAAGPLTGSEGMLGYNEICLYINNEQWAVEWQDEQRVPYAYKGNNWVGYDDVRSLEEKVNYVRQQGLGGVMMWSVDTDDFHGRCGGAYPLLNTLNHVRN